MEFSNIREVLVGAIGQSIVEITQDDWEDVEKTAEDPAERHMNIYLHLSSGNTLKFEITKWNGFWYDGITL